MEQFLNGLLMGKNPDRNNASPSIPGFLLICTQNPTHMAGRNAASNTSRRRMTTLELLPYTYEEMVCILLHQGIDKEEASLMVTAYEKQARFAVKNQLTPTPCFTGL